MTQLFKLSIALLLSIFIFACNSSSSSDKNGNPAEGRAKSLDKNGLPDSEADPLYDDAETRHNESLDDREIKELEQELDDIVKDGIDDESSTIDDLQKLEEDLEKED